MTTTEKPRAATYAQVVHIPANLIADNPWQPRTAMDPDELNELADSIYRQGLLQPPLARQHTSDAGEVFQLAFGHRRVAAIRQLINAGLWQGDVPCSVQELSDQDMALTAIAENVQRQDLTPIECIRAYQRMLDDIAGLTISQLAEQLEVGRSTLSNNLRLLKLPELVLDRVESGEMPTHSAREFLCLLADDHVHEDLMQKVIREISQTSGQPEGAPDWRYANVRALIRHAVRNGEQVWRPLEDNSNDAAFGFDGNGSRSPSFDVEAYTADFENLVHSIPAYKGVRRWTCNAKEWRKRQTAATKAANKADVATGKPAAGAKAKDTAVQKAFADDPVLKQHRTTVSRETPSKGKELTTGEKEALGTRAEVLKGHNHNRDTHHLDDGSLPPGFPDIEECRTQCIWGAKYLQQWAGDKPVLICTNEQAFNDKKSRGIEAFKRDLAERVTTEDQADKVRVDEISDELLQTDEQVPRMIAETVLILEDEFRAILPHRNGDNMRYHPAVLTQAFKTILGIELDPNRDPWSPKQVDSEATLEKLKTLSQEEAADLAAALLVWTARTKNAPALS